MRRTPPSRNPAVRVLPWVASATLHVLGAWLAILAWPIVLILFWLSGIPSDDSYTFRWDNPYFRGSSGEAESGEDAVFITLPRPRRELPEMEKPRSEAVWDSRRLPFDEALGVPSPFENPFRGAAEPSANRAKGDSLDYVSDKPFRGKGTYDSLGSGGGGGGRYGSTVVLKDAVQLGLLWLARHQKEDGSWDTASDRCGRALPNGREVTGPPCGSEAAAEEVDRWTALAAMAFRGANYFPDGPDVWDGLRYGDVVGRAWSFLSRPPRSAQALRLLALSSFLRPPSRFDPAPAEAPDDRLLDLLVAVEADPPPAAGSEEAAWAALALHSAGRAGLEVSPAALQRAAEELRRRGERPALEPAAWPGEDLARAYLRLLASYEESVASKAALPAEKAFYPRLRAGQCRDADACREGSWEPVGRESRLSTTLFHLLALQSLPGYGFRARHPLRPSTDPSDLEAAERIRAMRADSHRAAPGALRRGIQRVRAAWLQGKDAPVEAMIREAFKPVELTYVRYVPKVEIGDHLESDNDEEFLKFKPLTRLGGKRDLITEAVYQGLRERDGIVGFNGDWDLVAPDQGDDLTSLGKTLIFTLPDGTVRDGKPVWERYVVIGFPTAP